MDRKEERPVAAREMVVEYISRGTAAWDKACGVSRRQAYAG